MLKAFSHNKNRIVSIFVALFVVLALTSGAFAAVKLVLTPPENINLNNVTLTVYPGTGSTGAIAATSSTADKRVYELPEFGTYNYRVAPGVYTGVVKLMHFASGDYVGVDDPQAVMEVKTTEFISGDKFGPPTNNSGTSRSIQWLVTDQIEKLLGTGGLKTYPAAGLQTPTFSTQKRLWQVTTQRDLMNFVNNLQAKYPKLVRWWSLGKSAAYNYDVPIVIVSKYIENLPADATFEDLAELVREGDTPTFFHMGSIHADEASGAEGVMAMLLEMTENKAHMLDKVNYAAIPRISVDAARDWVHYASSPIVDPRFTYDPNSDHLRLIYPENRRTHYAFLKLMPEVVMDGHEYYALTLSGLTTSASADAYATNLRDLTATPATSWNNPTREVTDLGLYDYGIKLFDDATEEGLRIDHYGITVGGTVGRAYFGLMGAVSFLCEGAGTDFSNTSGSMPWGAYVLNRRAWAQATMGMSLLKTLHDNADAHRALIKEGRDYAINRGKVFSEDVVVYLSQVSAGGIYTPYSGQNYRAHMNGTIEMTRDATMQINSAGTRNRPYPTAYVIPKGIATFDGAGPKTASATLSYAINYDYLLDLLDAQGIEYFELEKGTTAPLRQYYRTDTGNSSSNTISAALRDEADVVFENGAYGIPMDQATSSVIAMLFEPDNGNNNAANAAITSSTSSATNGIALVVHHFTNRDYPYYRLEKDNPRVVLGIEDEEGGKKNCKECLMDWLEELCEEGCNAGIPLLALLALAGLVFRRKF